MAGDWIKMRADLQTHPKVVRILSGLKCDKLTVIGGLHAVWCIFDAHSTDGELHGYTLAALDSMIGFPGFAREMAAVGWLEETPQGLVAPEFSEHNGASAKTRATESARRRKSRQEAEERPESVRVLSGNSRPKTGTREEKRRDIKPPNPPAGGCELFDEFLKPFPESRRIKTDEAKREFAAVIESGDATAQQLVLAITKQAAAQGRVWSQDGGRSCPAPARWLRERRWLDSGEGVAAEDAWSQTRSGIEAMGERMGVGRWDQGAFSRGEGEAFPTYERRVRAAMTEAGQTADLNH